MAANALPATRVLAEKANYPLAMKINQTPEAKASGQEWPKIVPRYLMNESLF